MTGKKNINIKNPTDFQRWEDCTDTWGEKNPLRSQITAKFIANGSSVLDIGAGSMVLRKYLQPNCRYQPCDLYSRCDGCLVADLNNKEFPEGKYDWVVMLGTFQFLKDPAWAVAQCRKVAKYAAFSYSPTINEVPPSKEIKWWEGEGWINHFNRNQYFEIIRNSGWNIIKVFRIPCNYLVICQSGGKNEK